MVEFPSIHVVEMATPVCCVCGKPGRVRVIATQATRWAREGLTVAQAFPEMDVALQEQIITGTHPDCWERMFAEVQEQG